MWKSASCAGDLVGLVLRQRPVALVGVEVVLHPEALAVGVDPLVRVRAVAVHVPPRRRDAAVAHQPGDLVRALRLQGPEVPLHGVVAEVAAREALLRADEVGELDAVLDEEDGGVVADEVVVALGRVELHREAAGVAPRVGAALLAGDGREADDQLRVDARLEERGPRVPRDVAGDLEVAEGAAALRVHDPLRHALAVELRELLEQVVVGERDGAVRADALGVLVARDRCSAVGRGGVPVGHTTPSSLRAARGGAVGAQAPERDLRRRDGEAVRVGEVEAGRLSRHAVHVDDAGASRADEVVVVVADAGLVPCGRAGRLDAAQQRRGR